MSHADEIEAASETDKAAMERACEILPERRRCQGCAACCTNVLIRVFYPDLWREPKLKKHVVKVKGRPGMYLPMPCPFLFGKNCEIYPTRPTACCGHVPETHPKFPQYDPE
jgi:Fe-S-cluster containining protein